MEDQMSKFVLEKEFNVAMGHRLTLHKGGCKNIHGHNLKVIVGIESLYLNKNGMVVDFSEIKRVVSLVLDSWDHSMIVNDQDLDTIKFLSDHNYKFKLVSGEPTSENLCLNLAFEIQKLMNDDPLMTSTVRVHHITIFETDSSKMTYYL
jgi:6-pyruvoyltetrahydropterin/6-carboxytetrahydropterin synthase